jgi:chromate transporter
LAEIFFTWLLTGVQSFGGGSSTFYLIHQACIRKRWLDEDTFVRTWALSQISPGINLLKLTVLIGFKLRGWPGLLAGVAGLLIPSAAATVLMTAGFAEIRGFALVQAAMRGILPATIGLSLAMAVQMGQPLVMRGQREGPARLVMQLSVMLAAALLLALWGVSPLIILLAAGGVTIGLHALLPARPFALALPAPPAARQNSASPQPGAEKGGQP